MSSSSLALLDGLAVVTDARRLAELRATGLLDAAPCEPFDRITRLTQRLLDVTVAMISLVDRDYQHIKSCVGPPDGLMTDLPLPVSSSFCQYAVATGERFVVADAHSDLLLRDSPAVAEQGVVAYVGQPLQTSSGHVLGTLCIVDGSPRHWQAWEMELLEELAALAVTEIEYRLRSKALGKVEAAARRVTDALPEATAAVQSLSAVADRNPDPRVGRLAALVRSRLATAESAGQVLLECAGSPSAQRAPALSAVSLAEKLLRVARIVTPAVGEAALAVEVPDTRVQVLADPFAIEAALSHALVSALHHTVGDAPVAASVSQDWSCVRLRLDAPGARMPVSELTRIVARLQAALAPPSERPGNEDRPASIKVDRGATTVENGSVRGTLATGGMHLSLRVPVVDGEGAAVGLQLEESSSA